MSAAPNHRRTKPGGIKTAAPTNGSNGPTSQIPGLSQSATEGGPEARISGRRVGIFATDSDYVKLAKQGGQKGLLCHEENVEDKTTKPYTPSDWYNAPGPNGQKSTSKATSPDIMTSEGYNHQPLAAPFGTDNISAWERESDSFTHGKEKKSPVDDAACIMENMSITEVNKYKKMSYDKKDKKTTPVSMSKLLSFGYVEEEEKKSTNDDDASSVTSEQTSTIAPEDEDDLE